MAEGPTKGAKSPKGGTDNGVDALAARALSVVAAKATDAVRKLQSSWLNKLQYAARYQDRDACFGVVQAMVDAGIPREDVSDLYIPEIARRLGEEWCEDETSFVEVTIGTSRLQALLRLIGPEWSEDNSSTAGEAALVIVAMDDYHTLGAMVLAGQLRRAGVSVRLALGAKPDDAAEIVKQSRFNAIMISAYHGESLERLRRLVESVRKTGEDAPPIIVGGALLTKHKDAEELARLLGADYATNDVDEALALCGLNARISEATLTKGKP